jgi:light-regulated signal transduction histidine kinase (bacteriophytochrome)
MPEYVSEKRYVRKDGSVRWEAVHARLVREPDGRPRSNIGIINDISERKRAEEALQQAADELKRSNRDLEQFASVASHDMQEPLRAVSGYARLLQRGLGDKLDAKNLEYLTGAVEGAARMEQLVNDLLAVAHVGTGDHPRAPAKLNEVLNRARSNLEVTFTKARAKLTSKGLPTLVVDAAQITQLFQNLLANAVKFCRAVPPEIDVRATQEPGRWVISVRDNGIGIPPESFDRIFQIFQRLHIRKQYPGTGIGLTICKRIVERHGGDIWVESQPGQGSTFYFSIPKTASGPGASCA